MQLSCWHNIKAADYGHLIEGNNNYDHLAQKQVCDPQPDENVNSTLFCSEKNTEPWHGHVFYVSWRCFGSRISFWLNCFGRTGEVLQCMSCLTEWTWATSTIAGLSKGWWETDRLKLHIWTRNIALVLVSWCAPHNLTSSRAISGLFKWWNGLFHKTSCFKQFVLKPPFPLVVLFPLFAFSLHG